MSEERAWHGPSERVSGLTYSLGQRATKIANLGPDEDRKVAYQAKAMHRALTELIEQAQADRRARLDEEEGR